MQRQQRFYLKRTWDRVRDGTNEGYVTPNLKGSAQSERGNRLKFCRSNFQKDVEESERQKSSKLDKDDEESRDGWMDVGESERWYKDFF